MDGEEVGRHLVTEAVPQEEEEEGGKAQGTGGSYSWSSYLTMSAKDWHAHSRFSCQLEHESSGEPLVAVGSEPQGSVLGPHLLTISISNSDGERERVPAKFVDVVKTVGNSSGED
eukprot:g25456.t1